MIAKNNIFNIRKGSNWKGTVGSNKGFVVFSTIPFCVRAWWILMRTYRRKYLLATPRQIISRFAPPFENNTPQYINFVCQCSALSPDTVLTSQYDYAQLARAMAIMETGTHMPVSYYQNVAATFNIVVAPETA